jgi:hypothetical protein
MKHQKSKHEQVKSLGKMLNRLLIITNIILIIFLALSFYYPSLPTVEWYMFGEFDKYVTEFQNDSYILNVSNYCRGVPDEATCVWENTPYDYNTNRSEWSWENIFGSPVIMSPKDYFTSGGNGICRDNAVITKAILDNLNIPNKFVLAPRHIYVIAYYNNHEYIFNNALTTRPINNSEAFAVQRPKSNDSL